MDYQFSSKEELFIRVGPALRAKVNELHRLGFSYIQDLDIWNFLIETKWCKARDLMLSDIVNDILHVKAERVDEFFKIQISKTKRSQYLDNTLEIL